MFISNIDLSITTIDPSLPPGIHCQYDVSSDYGDWSQEGSADLQRIIDAARARASLKSAKDDDIHSLSDLAATPYIDPSADHAKKQGEIARKHLKAFKAATARLNELKVDARAEGCTVSPESEKDFLAFLNCRIFTRRPFITLLDNGNLRALWKNAEGEQIGLQFLGAHKVQYVLFAKRIRGEFMARASGRDTLSDIDRQIEAHNLGRLMTA